MARCHDVANMGLRGRLALFFVAITVVPMTVAVGALQVQIIGQERQQASTELDQVAAATVAHTEALRRQAGELAAALARLGGEQILGDPDPGAAQAWLANQALGDRADLVVVVGADGTPLASVAASPPPGAMTADDVARRVAAAAAGGTPGALPLLWEATAVVGADNPETPVGWITAGQWLNARLLDDLAPVQRPGSGAAFVADGALLAASARPAPAPDDLPPAGETALRQLEGDDALVRTTALRGTDAALVQWRGAPGGVDLLPVLGVLAAGLVAAAPLGWVLAGGVIGPVERAAGVARAVAGGDLSRSLEPRGARELVDLAQALNTMSAELSARLGELERSRDQLRTSVSRFRETLSSSLDLDRIVSLVVETAVDLLHADGAALALLDPDRGDLEVKETRGASMARRLDADAGIAGHVVRTGQPVRLPGDHGAAQPAVGEPPAAFLVAVPLHVRGRSVGVLMAVRDDAGGPFGDDDFEAARTLAAQASVAIENVLLHRETERLSLTNPVTGLWNDRYFRTQLDAELKRVSRVRRPEARPVSVLVIDIDHFKRINDEYDHAAGDAALAEVGRRLRDATRAPDIVTHLHGEEFAVLLPDTGFDGALAAGERMRAAVADGPVRLPGAAPDGGPVELVVTCSVGVATFPAHASDRESLYRAADRAMLRAKEGGRNQVVGASRRGGHG